jgi:acetate kinase
MSKQNILVINGGSSTIKYGIFADDGLTCFERRTIETDAVNYDSDLEAILNQAPNIKVVGHRVVHGGQAFSSPVFITNKVMATLKTFIPLAPLHQPYNLKAIERLKQSHSSLPQIACFDTAFHRSQPRLNQIFPLPKALSEEGVIRYGFHGLSYEYICAILPRYTDKAQGRVIVLHLGNGASACAMENRISLSSTMGFTALDGLMMGTRSGSIDPGVILYLLEQKNMSVQDVTRLLYKQSGLTGVSGISADMRDLIENKALDAQNAVELFCHYATRAIGQLSADLQGVDVLVFTAGIGEHQPIIRQKICEKLAWLGVTLDAQANENNQTRISHPASAVDVLVLPTDEEKTIAQHSCNLMNSEQGKDTLRYGSTCA